MSDIHLESVRDKKQDSLHKCDGRPSHVNTKFAMGFHVNFTLGLPSNLKQQQATKH